MRTALGTAIGLAVFLGGASASRAQDSPAPGHGNAKGTGIEAEQRQTHDQLPDGPGSEARVQPGTIVAAPIGRVVVGPEFVDGELIYVRREARGGMAIVEVSTTPFAPEYSAADASIVRPDQPAGW